MSRTPNDGLTFCWFGHGRSLNTWLPNTGVYGSMFTSPLLVGIILVAVKGHLGSAIVKKLNNFFLL